MMDKCPNIEAFVTGRELAKRIPIPKSTLKKALQENGVMPDGFAIKDGDRAILLFRVSRLPAIRRAILGP